MVATPPDPPSPLSVFAPGLFRGTTALVTGGGRGIGRAIAVAFARLGANVVIASRKAENLAPTAKEIEALGAQCLSVPMSIREPAQVEALVGAAYDRFGKVDFVVNNAGGQFPAAPKNITDNGWRAVVDLNLHGTWNVCSRVLPRMVEQKHGAIVNVVHIYSFDRGAPAFAHSGAARAGVVSLTRTLAAHYARHGITVNAIAPGSIDTRGLHEEEYARMPVADYEAIQRRDIPAGRLGTADEVAAAVLFLCSPAGRYFNGAALVMDGGLYVGPWTAIQGPEGASS